MKTRKLLISSLIMILTCCLLFAGTTFAWFTDSVTSGNNVITAGNLDIELEYKKANQSNYLEVTETVALFNSTSWEPGHVEAVVLKVSNAGSLSLKYSLSLDVLEKASINVDGVQFLLSDYLELGTKITQSEETTVLNSRASAVEFVDSNKNEDKFAAVLSGTLAAGEVNYIQIAIVMPETVGNEANHAKGVEAPSIEFTVNLFATQLNNEKDSFGPDYDVQAPLPWLGNVSTEWYTSDEYEGTAEDPYVISNADELAGLAALVNGTATSSVATYAARSSADTFKGKVFRLTSDVDLAGIEWAPIGSSSTPFEGSFDGQGHTIYKLNVAGAGKSNQGLFGLTRDGEITNFTVHNATVTGRTSVGVVAGQPYTTKYSNITVSGLVQVNGFAYVGGVLGKNAYADVTNVTVNVTEDSYVKAHSIEGETAYRTYVGGVIGFMGEGSHTVSNVTSNIDVLGSTCDAGGIVGIAHYNNTLINCVSTGDVSIYASDVDLALEIGGIAGVWHNENGTKVTLKYCSFKGTLSSNLDVDLSNNTLTGAAYNATGTGELIILDADLEGVEVEIEDAVVDIRDISSFALLETVELKGLAVYTFDAAKFQSEFPVEQYKDWTCDFFVSTDKGVSEGIVLAGNYGSWGWIGFEAPAQEEAYENVGLLGVVSHDNESNWTYHDICEYVSVFRCGIVDTTANNANASVNVTVVLRMTSPDKTQTVDVWTFTTSLSK
jgi:predicted ribosomally synthesized peptide with SipW-like signal peptide